MDPQEEIEAARLHAERAAVHLQELVVKNCPAGPEGHRLVQHNDGRPPWCPKCDRTKGGMRVSAARRAHT